MKNKLLFLLPVIALSACSSLGKEITPEEATAQGLKIVEKQNETSEFSFSYTITNNLSSSTETRKYQFVKLEFGDYMLSREEKEKSGASTYEISKTIYSWRLSKSSRVYYVKEYNGSTKQSVIKSYRETMEDHEAYDQAVNEQDSFEKDVRGYFDSVVYALAKEPEVAPNLKGGITFYSNGESNLTAKQLYKYDGEASDSTIKTIERTYKYNDDLFANFSASLVTFGGQKRTENAKCSYSNVKITFPSDWQDHLIRQ